MSGMNRVKTPATYVPTAMIPMTLQHITWSTEEMSMKEFVAAVDKTMVTNEWNDVENEATVMCRVVLGYHGCDLMHEFSTDEMYWVRKIDRQKRLVVMDTRRRYLSIPVNYYRKFIALEGNGQKYVNSPLHLCELKDGINNGDVIQLQVENDEPVLVDVGSHGSSGSTERLGTLHIVEFYDEKYLVAHSVVDGYVYRDAMTIPVYVPIAMSIAEGFKPKKMVATDFNKWMTDINKIVSKFPCSQTEMSQEIIVFDEKPNSEYEYLTPAAFVMDRQRRDCVYEEIGHVGHEVDTRMSRFRPRTKRHDAFGNQRSELPPLICASTAVRHVVVSNACDALPLLPPRLSDGLSSSNNQTPPPLPAPPIPARFHRSMSANSDVTQQAQTARPDGLPPRTQSHNFTPSCRRPAPAVPEVTEANSDSPYRNAKASDTTSNRTTHAYQRLVFEKRKDPNKIHAEQGISSPPFRIQDDS